MLAKTSAALVAALVLASASPSRAGVQTGPRAYQMIEAFGLARADIVFAAFGGWDAAGAKSFGYRTFWCNRLKLPTEQLDVLPDAAGDDMTDLVRFLRLTAIHNCRKVAGGQSCRRAQQWCRRWRHFSTREALSVRRRYGLSRIR